MRNLEKSIEPNNRKAPPVIREGLSFRIKNTVRIENTGTNPARVSIMDDVLLIAHSEVL